MDPGSSSNWKLEQVTTSVNLNKNPRKTNIPDFRASLLYCPMLRLASKATGSKKKYYSQLHFIVCLYKDIISYNRKKVKQP